MKNAYALAQKFLRESWKLTYRENVRILKELLETSGTKLSVRHSDWRILVGRGSKAMLKKKPKIGDRVVTGNPDCCWSEHKEGSLGIIVSRDRLKDWGGLVRVGKEEWWHCRKCLSLPKTK